MNRELITMISPMWIKNELDKVVSGQDEAKKSLAILGYNHYLRFHSRVLQVNKLQLGHSSGAEPPRLTGLITGPTGTGKTYLIECMANILNFPYLKIDATQISRTGYVGANFTEYVQALRDKYSGTYYADNLDNAIIFIDEIDKLGGKATTTDSNDHNKDIQYNLLTFIDGSNSFVKDMSDRGMRKMDTTKLLFIFGGAFENVYKLRQEKKQGLGFHANTKSDEQVYSENLTREEMESVGMVREFLGRIHVITHTVKLTRDEIHKVLFTVKDNLVDQFKAIFHLSDLIMPNLQGPRLEEILDKIDKDNNYGMRYVKTILFDHFKNELFHLDCNMKDSVDKAKDAAEKLCGGV